MAQPNSIFSSKNNTYNSAKHAYMNGLDNGVMSKDEEKIFNTYAHWGKFPAFMQNVLKDGHSKDKQNEPAMEAVSAEATKSLFSNTNAVFTYDDFRIDTNMPLLDTPSSRVKQNSLAECTINDLVNASKEGKMGRQIYNYSDFAYCTHLGKLPNNYLITLRRFGAPCGDKIDKRSYASAAPYEEKLQHHMPDIGRLVTWMGTPGNDMSNILKYSYGMEWEEQKAEIQQQESDEGGPLASIFNMANANYRTQVQKGIAGTNFSGKKYMEGILGKLPGNGAPPYQNADWLKNYDSTKVYGPVDVIDTTKKRKRGLKFEQKFSLVFDYELRSYYGVNGKAAMVDLLANILATTFTHGTFWGGERKFIGAMQDNIFANLPIFKLADSGGLNNPGAVITAFIDSIHQGSRAFSSGVKGESTIDKIINFAKDMGGMLLGGMLNKLGRPQKYALASLISGAPVGCWHLTIGNPKSPIIEVGNLICTNAEIEHYGPLGIDDFPTGIRVKVDLEHGKPRDIMGIEQMYVRGDTRIYSPMGDKILNMYNKAKTIKDTGAIGKTYAKVKNEPKHVANRELTTLNKSFKQLDKEAFSQSASDDIQYLMRYFGTTDQGLIKTIGSEALYGSEKHKNDHVKK